VIILIFELTIGEDIKRRRSVMIPRAVRLATISRPRGVKFFRLSSNAVETVDHAKMVNPAKR